MGVAVVSVEDKGNWWQRLLVVITELKPDEKLQFSTRTTPPPVFKVGGSANAALMETAMVMVTAGVRTTLARALLDSGASVSLVSGRLVKAIQARTTPNPVELSGLYSTGLSKCTVYLTLSSTYSTESKKCNILYYVMDGPIPVTTPDMESTRCLPFLQDKDLTDW